MLFFWIQHCHFPNAFVQVKSNNILTHSLNSCSVSSVSGFGNLSAEALCGRDGLPAQWVLNHWSVHFSRRNEIVIVCFTLQVWPSATEKSLSVKFQQVWIKHFQLAVVLRTFDGFSSLRSNGKLQTCPTDDHGGAGGCGQGHRVCQRAGWQRTLGGSHLLLYRQTTYGNPTSLCFLMHVWDYSNDVCLVFSSL